MAENKVRLNIQRVHYAVLTETIVDGVPTYSWGTPVAMPGAVTLDLPPVGEREDFYADGIVYYTSVSNQGYEGDLELARVPDSFFVDIFGDTVGGTSKVQTENANTEPKRFALLFQEDGNENSRCAVLYNCTAERPSTGAATSTQTRTPQTQTMSIRAVPLADGRVKAVTTYETPAATVAGWFASVFEETA